ncbi:MAG: hypothetical protein ACPGVU_23280 [Limisphaerales bacterium]
MATAYERAMNANPELYEKLGPDMVNLVRMLSTYGLGGLSETNWRKLEGEGFHLFVSWNNDDDWVAIFAENDEGQFERFGYNRKEERWAFGVLPAGAGAVLNFIGNQ